MSKTATEISMEEMRWGNMRRKRAEAFVAMTMQALKDVIPDDRTRDAYYALADAYNKAGIEALTDHERDAAGLERRGELGWTPTELRVLEAKRLELMIGPIRGIFSPENP